jgi:CheY-like chemotaxis protein
MEIRMAAILIVEDDPDNQNVLATMLQIAGHTNTIAANGTEAVKLAEDTHPDIILMDIGLPIMDGWEAIERIKAKPDLARIPVIAVTAYATTDDAKKAFTVGCSDYMPKPIDYYVLVDKLNAVLARSSD